MPKRKGREGRQGLRVVTRAGTSSLYLRGTVRRRSIFESAGTDDPILAEEARATREAALYRSAIHGTREKTTFAKAVIQYLKRPADDRPVSQHTRHALGRVLTHFGSSITCDQIDQAAIDAAGRALCREGAKAATILRAVVTPTRAVLSYAARRGWCNRPEFEVSKGGGRRTDWFTPAEAEALIDAAASHVQPLLVFLFTTGARVGEAVALDWRSVDLPHCRLTLVGTKNGDDRIIDLPPRAVAALANLSHRTGRVFLTPPGNPRGRDPAKWVPYRLSGDNRFGSGGGQIKRSWATAMKGARIERHLTPHHARHSWASWSYLLHKDIVRLRIDGGWRTISQCERYTKLAPEGLRGDVEVFLGSGVREKGNSDAA